MSVFRVVLAGVWVALLTACESVGPDADTLAVEVPQDYNYIIGPGDNLNIFVWRNPELTQTVPVRPDGRLSVPLVEDLQASGKTATELAREVEEILSQYIREPLVTVIVQDFAGVYDEQIRVVGEAAEPRALTYSRNMTILDVMIAVGGLTEFADGNQARLVRRTGDSSSQYRVRLEDLLKDGDISANVPVAPGDVVIIPEAWF
ncbi:MAG: sugar ABC transporter substrate-binding protein [Gammaproteobacteria bacterium]|nr:sugar ABC transporter substrate-binding protein [Gammaproteobacteria bacterium]